MVNIVVRDNNVEQALRTLKKKVQKEQLFKELRSRLGFEKPSERKAKAIAEAKRRMRKLTRRKDAALVRPKPTTAKYA
jgi:small subunit ribosomal protein S21